MFITNEYINNQKRQKQMNISGNATHASKCYDILYGIYNHSILVNILGNDVHCGN